MSSPSRLTPEIAAGFARIALGHVTRPWPYKLDQVLASEADLAEPRRLHPIFFGSFDWHSCVHGYWLLAAVRRRFPDHPVAVEIDARFAEAFTEAAVEGERAVLRRPLSRGFERPYGWAWLLKLQAELRGVPGPWAERLAPLAADFADRFRAHLPLAAYPVRTGVHSSTAFAVALALDYARVAGDQDLEDLLKSKALSWYGQDRDCQAWEPSGEDFLSPALMEAECLRRVLAPGDFRAWFAGFLPRAAAGEPASLFTPASVSDRSDGKIAHLDGLNLSRAWCWRSLAGALDPADPAAGAALAAAELHLEASLPHVAGDYMGEHWLASFALLALTAGEESQGPVTAAASALREGRLVILPTETVYGLAADAGNPRAVAAVYAAKGRPAFNPLIAHVASVEAAREIAVLSPEAEILAAAFWPGPLTLVLPVQPGGRVCDLARAGLDTVAVRVPAHPLARAVLEAFGGPVAAPSANRSGRPSPTTFAAAMAETGSEADVALDGGPCEVGLESTVVSLLDQPRLLRPGRVTREEVEALVGPLAEAEADARRSPGRLTRHYAPEAPVRLEAEGARPGEIFLAFGPAPEGAEVLNLSPAGDLVEAAANLFSFLREADGRRPAGIAVAPIPETGLGEAINDRLRRAAGAIG
jgi:L-threonylcarbamoyladenylate synthase